MQEALKQQIFKETTAAALPPQEKQQLVVDGHVYEKVRRLATGSAVVLFGISDCCMCHVAKRLLFSLGVAPTVIELDRLSSVDDAAAASDFRAVLSSISSAAATGGGQQPLPAVFIGGKLLGGVESLMACHINGSLVPLLKEAGALWL